MDDEQEIFRGEREGYWWLVATGDVYMGTVVDLCPEALMGRYLAVTSTDSSVKLIRYISPVLSVEELEYQRDGPDGPGFDEWYLFPEPRELSPVFHGNFWDFDARQDRTFIFVNWPGFQLLGTDAGYAAMRENFWIQLARIAPETYIADGWNCTTLVSRNRALLDVFQERLESRLKNIAVSQGEPSGNNA